MDMRICPNCGKEINKEAGFCKYCGCKMTPMSEDNHSQENKASDAQSQQKNSKMTCPSCGAEIPAGSIFCKYCRAQIAPQKGGRKEKSKSAGPTREKLRKRVLLITLSVIGIVLIICGSYLLLKGDKLSGLFASGKDESVSASRDEEEDKTEQGSEEDGKNDTDDETEDKTEYIDSILLKAEEKENEEDYEGALILIKAGLLDYPDSVRLKEKEEYYNNKLKEQKESISEETDGSGQGEEAPSEPEEANPVSRLTPVEKASGNLNDKKYTVYDCPGITWNEAKTWCENQNGRLAVLATQEDQMAVVGLLQYGNEKFYFLGATDEGYNDNDFHWINGQSLSSGYTNWGEGSPDNAYINGEYEHYLGISNEADLYGQELYSWNDYRNDSVEKSRGFVCEWSTTS